ncbi:protein Wnt-10a-like isoform X2 [Clavelina lepadiformis]
MTRESRAVNANTVCGNTLGLTPTQQRQCYEHPSAVAAALQGLQIAIHECKHQFKNQRWNCSALETRNNIPHTSSFLSSGTGYPETAFSYAITSAGVAHAVARACALGKIKECECVPPPTKSLSAGRRKEIFRQFRNGNAGLNRAQRANVEAQTFEHAGCGDNVNYGNDFSRKFLDSRGHSMFRTSEMRLHNNRVGRLIVSNNMRDKCKCHGQSGSCSQRTCWKAPPVFKTVGDELKRKYDNALAIDSDNLSNEIIEENSVQTPSAAKQNFPKESLIFLERSPTYCDVDPSINVQGTRGRYCNANASRNDTSSCAHLCCNRGHRSYEVRRMEKCRCKFHWCCHVYCDTCEWTERVSVCN